MNSAALIDSESMWRSDPLARTRIRLTIRLFGRTVLKFALKIDPRTAVCRGSKYRRSQRGTLFPAHGSGSHPGILSNAE
jgi:hypothetical protein